jgi:Zn-dependent M16 (insulinase) family peptidase
MSGKMNIHDAIEHSAFLHGEIAKTMSMMREYVAKGDFNQLDKLLSDQKQLAEKAVYVNKEIAKSRSQVSSSDEAKLNELFQEIQQALTVTSDVVEFISAEKANIAGKLRTLRNGKRAVESYAQYNGR